MPRTNVHCLTPSSPLNVQLTLSGEKVNMSTVPKPIILISSSPWIQIVDREDLNEPVGCFSNKFGMKTNNHATNLFKFPQSNFVAASVRNLKGWNNI